MKKTNEKKRKTRILLKLIPSVVSLIVGLVGGGEIQKIRINQELSQQIKSSNNVNITNNVKSDDDTVKDSHNILKKQESEIEKLEAENKKLKNSLNSKETLNQTSVVDETKTDLKTDTTETTDTKATTESEILELFHDGEKKEIYKLNEDTGSFKVNGEDYYSGVTIGNAESGFVLVSLNKQYTHMSFDIGRVDGSPINDGKLLIFRDEVKAEEYDLHGKRGIMSVDFDVTDTVDLTIQVNPDWSEYGIVNIKLE